MNRSSVLSCPYYLREGEAKGAGGLNVSDKRRSQITEWELEGHWRSEGQSGTL